ncbi:MAG: pyridoxamine 5'-phosphate oxidase family protein, partial [Chitinophagaceae bacterium]|nr:pyridoxamine 5'-phosphate oxidase family protein [Chitinophagaceae bacterium]
MTGHLTDEEINELLTENIFGRIGCTDGKQPYVVPTNYIFDGKQIIAHSATGRKIRVMRDNPFVCLEVDEVKSFTDWKSVIVFGRYEEITEEKEQLQAMKLFVNRMLHLKMSETAVVPDITETRVHPRSPGFIKPVVYR